MTDIMTFQKVVLGYYERQGRHDLPWRQPQSDGSFDPYHITVSEIMLQQTQVNRVIPKYRTFILHFPSVEILAGAPLSEVLSLWSGLGYNRRAKFLWLTAQKVATDFGGNFPDATQQLVTLPGIGANTAGAIMAYAFNRPTSFIETNIRTVFIHHFFSGQTDVPDRALRPFLEAALPSDDVRNWYWALMDYGTHLKQTVGNLSRSSSSYVRQSTFEGSRRQIRGQVLRLLTTGPHPAAALATLITDERLPAVLDDLTREELIEKVDSHYRLRML